MFSSEELRRYSRQMLLPDFHKSGQEKLKQGSVLVIGAGGLGSPSLYYLTAAGVGRIGILDFDVVDESNLQRQILYDSTDIGKSKVRQAAERLKKLNPEITIEQHEGMLDSSNAMDIISKYDVVIDGSDNLPTRYLVNDACIFLKKTLIYGAVFQFEGQVSVFNQLLPDGQRGPNYRDLYPEPPPPELVPSCNVSGVLGVLPGIIGAMQANEAMKVLVNMGTTLSGRLMIFDALDFITRFLNIRSNPDNPVSGKHPTIHLLVDYDAFCNPASTRKLNQITVSELDHLLREGEKIQLVDVREELEFELGNIGGVNIPLSTINANIQRLEKKSMTVVHCKSGVRSAQAIILLAQMGFSNLVNLKGGLIAWKAEIDNSLKL